MDIQEIKSRVNNILSKDTSVNVFFTIKGEDGQYIERKADLAQGETTEDFIDLFRSYLNDTIVHNDDLSLCNLSSADERSNAIFAYDYTEFPNELECIHDFNIDKAIQTELFSFTENSLSQLSGYIIYLGSMTNGIVLYKKHYPISLIKRDSFLLHKKDRRFVKIDGDDILRINGSAQVMKLGNDIFVLEIKNFERVFSFEELIRQRAIETIDVISEKGILEDAQVLKDSVTDNISFARKLSKVKENSPVISLGISNDDIIRFTKTNPGLKGKFKYTEGDKSIRLDTKASKFAFIKLLNDDYLWSELTNQNYDSIAKDRILTES